MPDVQEKTFWACTTQYTSQLEVVDRVQARAADLEGGDGARRKSKDIECVQVAAQSLECCPSISIFDFVVFGRKFGMRYVGTVHKIEQLQFEESWKTSEEGSEAKRGDVSER